MPDSHNPFASPAAPSELQAGETTVLYFDSAKPRGLIASILFAMHIMVGVAMAGMSFWLIRALRQAELGIGDAGIFDQLADLEVTLNFGELVLLVASAIMFIMWMHRAYKNVIAFGAPQLRYSPGWAIGAWFIPFVNLVKPYQVMREIALASDPTIGSATRWDREKHATPGVIKLWWTFFIMRAIASRMASASLNAKPTVHDLVTASYINAFYGAMVCLAALFAILTIQRIDNHQLARAAELSDSAAGTVIS